ncbi:unnamed protein product [Rhizoctonia solani]|uniref:Uncharacterized protein n=1 Tax=Rhizoctonia solani TaxID=456999 RepID=A0A8H2XBK9_9AGAM|nr:unnamed protein product [Rhizoctonia solani]
MSTELPPEGEPFDSLEQWLEGHYDPETGAFVRIEQSLVGSFQQKQPWVVELAFGPLIIRIVVDLDNLSVTLEAYVQVPFHGRVKLGSVKGTLKDGVTLSFNALVAKGFVSVFLKNGNELWIKYEVSSRFFPTIKGEHKIATLPI